MKTLITGGAGFIGINLAARLLEEDRKLTILDNLSRPGSEKNLEWLAREKKRRFTFIHGDIRNSSVVAEAVRGRKVIYHLAAQTAVTNSVVDPASDFEINGRGTLNLLEAVRQKSPDAIFIFSSTNKVYGNLQAICLREQKNRYDFKSRSEGVNEESLLDFHSPYGCSKGAADQYVRDYSRIYGLKTVVFRQSCIYGPHQRGNEDQGWVAHFVICGLKKRGVTIYGNGKQVRDLLFITDLLEAFDRAEKNIAKSAGKIYNIGGGRENTLSLLELIAWLEQKLARRVAPGFDDWRPGDQKIFVSDNTKLKQDLGWQPRVPVTEGLEKLFSWLKEYR